MVTKCANPGCGVPFRYFRTGKLFRVETSTGFERRRALGHDGEPGKPLRHLEFYWLCQDCAGRMTIVYQKESGVSVRPDDLAHSAVA
jgi:hypothetical protein